jgi:RNA polymerase sigma-70 factor (ECF subfamily)
MRYPTQCTGTIFSIPLSHRFLQHFSLYAGISPLNMVRNKHNCLDDFLVKNGSYIIALQKDSNVHLQYFCLFCVNLCEDRYYGDLALWSFYRMYDLQQEKSLVFATQEGNRNAFERLYKAFLPGLYGYVRARMSTTVDAEDLVSDVVLTVIQKLDTFRWRYPGSFRAWIFQIARRKLADYYRRNSLPHDSLEETETFVDAAPAPELQILRRELREDMLGLLNRLSTRKQEVVLLRYFGGLQNKEIAAVLDLDERTVSSYLSRALSELQKAFDQEPNILLLAKEAIHD